MPSTTYTLPPNTILHRTEGYLDSRPPASPVHLVQYDTTLPVLSVSLYSNGQPYTVPQNADVNIRMVKPDGTVIYNPALGVDAARTTAYIQIAPQMTLFAGDFKPILEITADGGIAGTSVLALSIDRNPVQNEKLQSADEYHTVQQLAAQAAQSAQSAAASAQAAAGSEMAASGSEISATGSAAAASESAAQTAQNAAQAAQNAQTAAEKAEAAEASAQAAQEAAEQAQQVSQGALGYYETPEALRTAHPTAEAGNWAIVGDPDGIWVWDVEGEDWVNSGQNIELSNYYTKPQTDQLVEDAKGTVFSIAVLASGWQGEAAPYTNTVQVEGMTAGTILSCIQLAPADVGDEDAEQASTRWDYLNTLDGAVEFVAESEKPTADFTILASTKQHLESANDIVVPSIDVQSLTAQILLAAHPVGSYYWSSENTAPGTLFGGTWEQIENKFVYAVGEGHEVNSQGGLEKVALTSQQNGPHDHIQIFSTVAGSDPTAVAIKSLGFRDPSSYIGGGPTGSSGIGKEHENMPPYICAYCWRRTA